MEGDITCLIQRRLPFFSSSEMQYDLIVLLVKAGLDTPSLNWSWHSSAPACYLFCLFSVVFTCFLLSLLLCACRNWFFNNSISCQNVTSYFPFSHIMLQTFDVSTHLWGWCKCTKVFQLKLHQWGKRRNYLLVWPWHFISI